LANGASDGPSARSGNAVSQKIASESKLSACGPWEKAAMDDLTIDLNGLDANLPDIVDDVAEVWAI
jgi:hypothetical protein